MALGPYPVRNALFFISASVAYNVHAQVPSRAAASSVEADTSLQRVEIKGNAEQFDAREYDTATRIVVRKEEIARHGDTTLADVLKRLPGITVNGSPGTPGGEIRMRGLGKGYTQVLLNGEAAPPGFAVDTISPDLIERIEILRATTAELSAQSIAGTINIVLRKAVKRGQQELKLIGTGSNIFRHAKASLQLSDKLPLASYSFNSILQAGPFNPKLHRTEDATDATGTQLFFRRAERNTPGNFRRLEINPSLSRTFDNGDTVTWNVFLMSDAVKQRESSAWVSALGPLPAVATYSAQNDFSHRVLHNELQWVHKIQGGATLDAKFALDESKLRGRYTEQGLDPDRRLVRDEVVDSNTRDKGAALTGKYSLPFWEEHVLITGWDAGFSVRDDYRLQHDNPLPGLPTPNSDERYNARILRLAVFAQDEWQVSKRLSMYGGFRWEGVALRSLGSTFETVNNQFDVLSPMFQVLWKLPDTANDQLRIAISRSYKAPTAARLVPRRYTSSNNSPVDPDSQGNPNLRPELAWGLDLGYEHFLGDGAMLGASAYIRRINYVIQQQTRFVGDRWLNTPVNGDAAQAHGLEVEIKLPLRQIIKAGPAINLRFNLTRNWSSVNGIPGPNNRLTDQTPVSANLGLDYKWSETIGLGGTFTFKSGGQVRLSQNNFSYVGARRELDMYANWKIDPKTQLRASVIDLLAQDSVSESQYKDVNGYRRFAELKPGGTMLRVNLETKF